MLKEVIYSCIEDWVQYTNPNNTHKGTYSNRLNELKIWENHLPYLSLYTNNEKDICLESDNVYIQLKLMYASFILILDDIIDNATITENAELIAHLNNIFKNDNNFINSRYPNSKKGLTLCKLILDSAINFFANNSIILQTSKSEFVSGVIIEIEYIIKIQQGNNVIFQERINSSALQGSKISCYLDLNRINQNQTFVDNSTMLNLSDSLEKLLAINNSNKTVLSEILSGEIMSPHFILACELTGLKPIDQKYQLSWYQSIAQMPIFKDRIVSTQVNLIKLIQDNFVLLQLDLPRFFGALNKLELVS
jgi:hypothetical protein